MRATWKRWFAGFAFALVLPLPLLAQGTTGTISGTVRDQTGAVLPNASIQVSNQETGRARTVTTDAGGRYRVASLELGTYTVQASLAGFRTSVKSGIVLTVGSEVIVDLTTEVGQITESVTVAAETSLVQTTSAELSGLVGDKEIRDLPLNGRSYEALAFLQPGVAQFNSASSGTTARVANGAGVKISVSGAPADYNSFLLDGTDIHDHSGFTPGSVARNNLGVDSILEFRVFTQSYSAEYGRTAGGVISAVTRSGSNSLHASAFEFLRNSALDARNFFDRQPTPQDPRLPPFRRNQFGAAAGGPVLRDRTFFFVSYEGLRERLSTTTSNTVPSAAARQGNLPRQTVTVSPLMKPYFDLWPLPNARDFGDGTGEFLWVNSNPTREDFGSVRIDHQFSEKFYLFGRLSLDDTELLLPGNLAPFQGSTTNRNTFTTMEWKTIVSPRLLHVFRVAFNRTNPLLQDVYSPPNDSALTFYPGRKWSITSNASSGGGGGQGGSLSQFGHINSAPQWFTQNIFQYADDVDFHHGRHSIRTGVNLERIQNNNIQASQDGTMAFGDIVSLLQARPLQYTARTVDSSINMAVRQWLIGYYFQDNFRVSDRLTLNLGLRHEFTTIPTEVHNAQANILDVINDTAPAFGTVWLQNPSLKAFGPRVGFASTPFGEGKPVIRGGFGIYHNQIMGRAYYQYARSAFLKNAVITNPLFPRPGLETVTSGNVAYSTWDPRPKTPTVYQYNFTIEQQLMAGTVVTAGYVGTHGFHWIRDTAPNGRLPRFTSDGRPFYSGGNRRNPAFGNIREVTTDSVSNYNGLQLQVTKRFSQKFQFQTSYTWSKATTDSTAWGSAHTVNTAPIALIYFDRHADKSLSSLHQSQVLAVNYTYRFPGNSLSGIAGVLAKGWEMSGILKASSGPPVSIEIGSNRSGDNNSDAPDRPDLRPGYSNNPKVGSVEKWYDPAAFALPTAGFYGNLGRNTVSGPGLLTVDFSLVKTFHVREGHTLTFRSEFFNLANRANFGIPNRTVFTTSGAYAGNAGVIQDLATNSRQVQFSLRYSF